MTVNPGKGTRSLQAPEGQTRTPQLCALHRVTSGTPSREGPAQALVSLAGPLRRTGEDVVAGATALLWGCVRMLGAGPQASLTAGARGPS